MHEPAPKPLHNSPLFTSPLPPLQEGFGNFQGMVGLSSTARPSHPPALDAPRRVLAPARAFLICYSLTSSRKGVARSSFTARIERAPLYRARSASKKDGLAAPCSHFSGRALREQRGRPHRPLCPLIHKLSSILPDTPLQSFPNPSETDPYPSTPSSSGPRIGRCLAKSHRPGSTCRCASQTLV
jgi:hypothetical protein